MTTMLIANNATRENGQFLGDQLCYIKAAYLFVQNQPDVDRVIMSLSPANEMAFLWTKFLEDPCGDGSVPPVEVVYDSLNPGDNPARWAMWDAWRARRAVAGKRFDHYRELYLRIHGAIRQAALCGAERGLGRRNIYEYLYYGQENVSESGTCVGADWYDDTLIYHPPHLPTRDVYISPHCKTQGNATFTFDYWSDVVHHLVDAGVSVTVGYDGPFCEDLVENPLYRKHWGDHRQWMEQVCCHKLVACGNTGTGWLAAACGVPLLTMEPHNSVMADHRYRECGLRNLVEVIDGHKLDELGNDMRVAASYCVKRIIEVVGGNTRHVDVTWICREGAAHSVNPYLKLKLLADQLLAVADVPGDLADLGSYRGGSALVLRKLAPERVLHLYDTWEGTPYDDPLCHHKRGEWKADVKDCQHLVGNGELTNYWDGVFPGSAGASAERTFALVYVDMDTYQATKDAIAFFWPRLVPSGRLVVDDYDWEPCAGVKKAVDEVFSFLGTDYRINVVSHTFMVEKI